MLDDGYVEGNLVQLRLTGANCLERMLPINFHDMIVFVVLVCELTKTWSQKKRVCPIECLAQSVARHS